MTAGDIAYACFTSCQQSHPFEDRRIPLITNDEPIKVGRAVAKLRATSENAIFDCKVLSRNHAMFWYADGKFYLKDTKSSNGTFVNNQRLSKGSEESPAKEIFSGDIVQFGVEIVENARQVTHGCIVAMVRLYLPDGREAVTPSSYSNNDPNFRPVSPTSNVGPSLFTTLTNQELFQLQQYIKEAAHREQMLETKLQSLQALVANTQQASQDGWQALIDEDRLLSRIDTLENQLSIYVKNVGEDKLREQLHELNEERFRYEVSAKESLRRALQEKMEAVQRLTDVERSLETTEDECARLRQDCESAQNELQVLATQHTDALVRIHSLSTQLEEAERRAKEAQDRFDTEKAELDAKISEMTRHESLLTAKVETLQSENDFDKEQLAAMKVRLDQLSVELDGISAEQRYSRKSESSAVQNEETKVGEDESVGEISERLNSTVDELNMYRKQLTESGTELGESKQLVQQLTSELAQAKLEMLSSAALVSDLEDLIVSNERRYAHAVDDAMRGMISNCEDAVLQKHRNEELMDYLREQVAQLENKLKSIRFNNSQRTMLNGRSNDAESTHQNGDGHGLSEDSYSVHDQYRHWVDVELENYKEQLRKSEELRERSDAMSKNLTKQIENYETRLTDACAEVEDMKELLTAEQDRCQILSDDVRLLKLELDETQTKAKERLSESEELRSKVTLLTEELELERSLRVHDSLDDENARVVLHLQAARNQAEFASLREECATLRERIAGIETEMKTSRKDNARLSSENQRLKHSYDLLMQQKACLENEEGSWRYQVDTARYESDILRNQLNEAREELMALREKRLEMEKEHSWTARNKGMGDNAMDQKYDELEMKTRTVTFCSAIPLFFLFVAILVAFLPFFSTLTATNSASGNDSQQ